MKICLALLLISACLHEVTSVTRSRRHSKVTNTWRRPGRRRQGKESISVRETVEDSPLTEAPPSDGAPAKPTAADCTQAGFYPTPGSCVHFYRCVDWMSDASYFSVFHFVCPVGTVFDDNIDICNYPYAAGRPECTGSLLPPASLVNQTSQPDTSTSGATTPSTSFTDATQPEITEAPALVALECHSDNKYRVHPEYCNQYYNCNSNTDDASTISTFTCQVDLIFDEANQLCLFEVEGVSPDCKRAPYPTSTPEITTPSASGTEASQPEIPATEATTPPPSPTEASQPEIPATEATTPPPSPTEASQPEIPATEATTQTSATEASQPEIPDIEATTASTSASETSQPEVTDTAPVVFSLECYSDNKYRIHPEYCNKYYSCSSAADGALNIHTFTCSADLIFNEASQLCDFEVEGVSPDCKRSPHLTPAPDITTPSTLPTEASQPEIPATEATTQTSGTEASQPEIPDTEATTTSTSATEASQPEVADTPVVFSLECHSDNKLRVHPEYCNRYYYCSSDADALKIHTFICSYPFIFDETNQLCAAEVAGVSPDCKRAPYPTSTPEITIPPASGTEASQPEIPATEATTPPPSPTEASQPEIPATEATTPPPSPTEASQPEIPATEATTQTSATEASQTEIPDTEATTASTSATEATQPEVTDTAPVVFSLECHSDNKLRVHPGYCNRYYYCSTAADGALSIRTSTCPIDLIFDEANQLCAAEVAGVSPDCKRAPYPTAISEITTPSASGTEGSQPEMPASEVTTPSPSPTETSQLETPTIETTPSPSSTEASQPETPATEATTQTSATEASQTEIPDTKATTASTSATEASQPEVTDTPPVVFSLECHSDNKLRVHPGYCNMYYYCSSAADGVFNIRTSTCPIDLIFDEANQLCAAEVAGVSPDCKRAPYPTPIPEITTPSASGTEGSQPEMPASEVTTPSPSPTETSQPETPTIETTPSPSPTEASQPETPATEATTQTSATEASQPEIPDTEATTVSTSATDVSQPEVTDTAPVVFSLECHSDNKLRVHPQYCNMYYDCSSAADGALNIHTSTCPIDLIFDEANQSCAPEVEGVSPDCKHAPSPTPLPRARSLLESDIEALQTETADNEVTIDGIPSQPETPNPSEELTKLTITPIKRKNWEMDPNSFYECPDPGYYPFAGNCIGFFKCVKSEPGQLLGMLFKCPEGYGYSEKEGKCLKKGDVRSCESAPDPDNLDIDTATPLYPHDLRWFFND